MAYTVINKKFIHFNNFDTFNAMKVSADSTNTKYTVGVEDTTTYDGTPDIQWNSIVFCKDTDVMWSHGKLYSFFNEDYSHTIALALTNLDKRLQTVEEQLNSSSDS